MGLWDALRRWWTSSADTSIRTAVVSDCDLPNEAAIRQARYATERRKHTEAWRRAEYGEDAV